MFGNKKTISDRIKEVLTEYIDTKFEDYRAQIALDLSNGLAALAGLIAIWTLAIVCVIFVSITMALLLGWLLSFWLYHFGYILSFLLIAGGLMGGAYWLLKNKKEYIEEPVFNIMSKTLRTEETVEETVSPQRTAKMLSESTESPTVNPNTTQETDDIPE